MRTTLTLDSDVALQIERARKASDTSFKEIVNEALRRGLRDMAGPPKLRKPYQTRPFTGSRLLIPVDNVAEAIAIAEGEDYK